MLKKELVCFIETTEEGEYIKVNRLDTDPGFFLLSLGQNRMVVNGAELMEAINAIDFYSTMFNEERKRKEQALAAPPKTMEITPTVVQKKSSKKVDKEDEGAIILEPSLRLGPTESELALERQTQHMKGESLVITEKK